VKNLALLLVAILVALFSTEVVLRVIGKYTPPDWPPVERSPGLVKADPIMGYRLYPSARTCLRYPTTGGPLLEVISNSDGFRSAHEFGARDSRKRVTVLGDSFVFGAGVEVSERFTDVAQQVTPSIRVDSVGQTGWGAPEMLRALEALGPTLDPDYVVLALYTQDFVRPSPHYAGMGFPLPKFAVRDGKLVDEPFAPPVGWRRARLWQLYVQLRTQRDENFLAINEAIFARMHESSRALGSRFAALFLPGRGDTPDDRLRRAALREWAARASVPFTYRRVPRRRHRAHLHREQRALE